jgi:hypothetical protein
MNSNWFTALMPKSRVWLVLLGCAVFVAVATPFSITKRQKTAKASICGQCGVKAWWRSDVLLSEANTAGEQHTYEDTQLSRWFTSHVSTNCEHAVWIFNRLSRQTYMSLGTVRLWDLSRASSAARTSPLVHLSTEDRVHLENLLRGSPEDCRSFLRTQLRGVQDTGKYE